MAGFQFGEAPPYNPADDQAINSGYPGADQAARMIDNGTPAPQVDQWRAQQRQQMLDAGTSAQDVDAHFGENQPLQLDGTEGMIRGNLSHLSWQQTAKAAQNPMDAFLAGLQISATGLMAHGQPTVRQADNPSMWDNLAAGLGEFTGDLPQRIIGTGVGALAGSAIGPEGTVLGGLAGGGLPEAVRQQYLASMDANPRAIRTFGDWWSATAPRLLNITNAAITNAVFQETAGAAGGALTKAGASPFVASAGAGLASVAAGTTAGAALEGRAPSLDDFEVNAAMGLGFGALHYSVGATARLVPTPATQQVIGHLQDLYRTMGVMPDVASHAAAIEPGAKSDLVAPHAADGGLVTPALDEIRPPEMPEYGPSAKWPTPTQTVDGKPVAPPATGPHEFARAMDWITKAQEPLTKPAAEGAEAQPLNDAETASHYFNQHWAPLDINRLPTEMRLPVFDAAVADGNAVARDLMAQSAGRAERFNDLRRARYGRLLASEPDKYGPQAQDWVDRLGKLETEMKVPTLDDRVDAQLAFQGKPGAETLPEAGAPLTNLYSLAETEKGLAVSDANGERGYIHGGIKGDAFEIDYTGAGVDSVIGGTPWSIGAKNIRPIARAIFDKYPDITEIRGLRVTGAREQARVDYATTPHPEMVLRRDQITRGVPLAAASGAGGGKGAPPPGEPPAATPGAPKSNAEIAQEFLSKIAPPVEPGGKLDWLNPKKVMQSLTSPFHGKLYAAAVLDRKIGLDTREGVEANFRQTLGSAGRGDQFIGRGIVQYKKDGTYGLVSDANLVKGLHLVKQDGGDLNGFTVMRLANRTIELAERGVETPFDLQDALAYFNDPENQAKYKRGLDMYREVNEGLVDYMRDAGISSAKGAAALKAKGAAYVNLTRVADPSLKPGGAPLGFGVRNPIRAITGSKSGIILDPHSTDEANTHLKVAMADRNRALGYVYKLSQQARFADAVDLKKVGDLDMSGKEEITDDEGNALPESVQQQADVVAALAYRKFNASPLAKDNFLYFDNGKPIILHTGDEHLASLLRTHDLEQLGIYMRGAQGVANWARKGIAAIGGYHVQVAFHAGLENALFTPAGQAPRLPFHDIAKGWAHAWKLDKVYDDWVANGGAERMTLDMARNPMGEQLRNVFGETQTLNHTWNLYNKWTDLMWAQAHFLDRAARIGRFKALQEKGWSAPAAAMGARKGMLDWDEKFRSDAVNKWASTVPFMNVGFKDLGQVVSALRDHPVQTVAAAMSGIGGLTVANYLANQEADKHLPPGQRYSDIPMWEKDAAWILPPIAGVRLKLRKPYVGGFLFGSLPERVLDWARTGQHEDFASFSKEAMARILPPFIPTVILPAVENYTDFSFLTGRKLIPASLEPYSGALQFGPNTSRAAVALAKVVNDLHIPSLLPGMQSATGIDDYMREWNGTLPYDILSAIGGALAPGPWHPATGITGNPFLSGFFARQPLMASQAIDQFYDQTQEVLTARADVRRSAMLGIPADTAAMRLQTMQTEVGQYRRAMSQIFKTIDAIQRQPLLSEEDATAGKPGLTANEKLKVVESWASRAVQMAQVELARMAQFKKAAGQ